jgi:phage tail-like protein
MSAPATKAYRLATLAQWRDGVLAGVVRSASGLLQPFAPYARPGLTIATSGGAVLPAIGGDGAAWWRGADGKLRRLAGDTSAAELLEAPHAIVRTQLRIVTGRHVLWAAAKAGTHLHCYALDDLRPILSASVAEGRIVDLADAGKDGVWALVSATTGALLAHFSCAGALVRTPIVLPAALPRIRAFAFLRETGRVALLAADGDALWFFDLAGEPRELSLAGLEEGAVATRLASDGRGLLFIGVCSKTKVHRVLVVDVHGDLLDTIDLKEEPTGIAARGTRLLVTGAHGATVYSSEGASTAATDCELITPVLYSPKRADTRGWLRAELSATLPPGTKVALQYAGFDDAGTRDAALHIARDTTLTPRQRAAKLGRLLGGWSEPVAYTGSADDAASPAPQLSVPLFDARTEYIWLRIRLDAPAGALLPRLEQVRVLYPDRSLIEHLPAIYRSEAPGDFLRELVGVLEATTQGLDRRIATLGRLLDPATADGPWLDYTARWLGLPWDDALAIGQKRALMQSAHRILATRGTRQSLETLLRCLFSEQPPRFRVRDTADSEPLRLGAGAALPAPLGGLPVSDTTLGRRAILGHARLPDPQAPGAGLAPLAQVRIDITTTAAERKQAELWLPAMINALIPVTARAVLRWRHQRLDGTGTALGDDTVLGEPPDASLGHNTIIGGARLPASRITRLPAAGADVGFHLR